MFILGMAINIHSDYILRNLRKPGEVSYKIPRGQYLLDLHSRILKGSIRLKYYYYIISIFPLCSYFIIIAIFGADLTVFLFSGGMFEWISGANFFGEIIEWCGFAVATWSFPAFAFAFFTICSIGPRAYHHHR